MKYPIIFLLGPTGIGKTEVAIELAFQINGEIISADSMQVYQGLDIGTSTPTADELRGLNYYLINVASPDKRFTAGDFRRLADKFIRKIQKKKKHIIICGGTGLYFDTLIYGLRIKKTEDFEYRKELKSILKDKGKDYLFNRLTEVDPEYAEKIHKNDVQRVIRALEVYKITGNKFSEFQSSSRENKLELPYEIFALTAPREVIYDRINARVDRMLDWGWIKEVKRLKQEGFENDLNSFKALGYFEIFQYLKGELTLDEVREEIAKRTRHYAKRQLTWIRKYGDRVHWIDRKFDRFKDVMQIINILKKNGGNDG